VVKSSADKKVVYMINNQDAAHTINISRVFILVGDLDGNQQSVIGTYSQFTNSLGECAVADSHIGYE
jgi:hypothetical protein